MLSLKSGGLAVLLAFSALPALAQAPAPTAGNNAPSSSMPTLPNPHPTGVPSAAVPGMDHQGQPGGHMAGRAPAVTGGVVPPESGNSNR